jgi:hypothetical protein
MAVEYDIFRQMVLTIVENPSSFDYDGIPPLVLCTRFKVFYVFVTAVEWPAEASVD